MKERLIISPGVILCLFSMVQKGICIFYQDGEYNEWENMWKNLVGFYLHIVLK